MGRPYTGCEGSAILGASNFLDFKTQQVGSSYSSSSIQFHRFHSLRGSFRRSIPDAGI